MIHDQVAEYLTAQGVTGPWVYDQWPADETQGFTAMLRVEGRGGDRQRQWERVGLTVFCRDAKRRTAEEQARKAYRALHMREAFLAGGLFVAWSETSGWPRPVGRDGAGNWLYRLEAELHLTGSPS